MRLEARVSFGAATFLLIVAIIYWFWSREWTGTVCLIFSLCAYGLMGSYFLLQWLRRQRIPRPEDRDDAEMSDGAGEIGFFPSASIWPPGMGLGGIFLGLGLIYGTWYWWIGGILLFGSIIGFVVEAEAREEGPAEPGMPMDPAEHGHLPITSTDVPPLHPEHPAAPQHF